MMRRRILALTAVTVLAMAIVAPASAFHCFVVEKPIGSGSAGALTFDVTTADEPDFGSFPFNPNSERVIGGFITLRIVAGPIEIGTWDILFQNTVGGKAHAAGPGGASECDGIGMDDLLACLGIDEE